MKTEQNERYCWFHYVLLRVIIFLLFFINFGKAIGKNPDSLVRGNYRAEITGYNGIKIPFLVEITRKGNQNTFILKNADEKIIASEIKYLGDSIFVTLPFFDAEFRLKSNKENLSGYWVRYLPGKTKKYALEIRKSESPRFKNYSSLINVTGLWEIMSEQRSHPNIGNFIQEKNGKVTGSILSVSGDDRYLEGQVSGDSLFLSTFDGAHAYLYTIKINPKNRSLTGLFYAADNHPVIISGKFNPKAQLENVYDLTTLKEGLDTISFTFPDLQGKPVHYPNSETHNKITIIQFLGSWCPNCMDETRFLKSFYETHKDKVSIIGLAYERSRDITKSTASVKKMSDRFGLKYPILITGYSNAPKEVMESLPELKNYMAFPTMIILDKKGKVRKIHTGFSGPGTGIYYTNFTKEFDTLFQELELEN